MYDRLEIFQLASGLASHSVARQAKIAENVANADTPGYRARDIAPFAQTYQAADVNAAPRSTRSGHLHKSPAVSAHFATIDRAGPSAPNGNTVSLETEMMNATEVRHSHDLALSVYQTSMNIIRTSLGRGR